MPREEIYEDGGFYQKTRLQEQAELDYDEYPTNKKGERTK